jgi:CubicO group peptidase (beta-lactamase class C family)
VRSTPGKAVAAILLSLTLLTSFNCEVAVYAQSDKQTQGTAALDQRRLATLEQQFDELRTILKIPGMSAVILRRQKVLWAKGFGFADLDKRVPATPETLYHIASLTKTFAATLIMQLVEQGKLDLDEPISHYSSDFKDDAVKIKHLLSHTSQGVPGDQYAYSGNRYAYLTNVLEKKTGKSFRQLLVETFLSPLGMTSCVPGHDVVADRDKWSPLLGQENLAGYEKSLTRFAKPYRLYGAQEIVATGYPPRGISAAAGLLSTVVDLARFDAAIDLHRFLKSETQERAWTPFVSNSGKTLPHGLGWFSEKYHDTRLIWHYGYWPDSFSATYAKVPEKDLTLILLANSDGLSAPFYYTGGVETNPFACTFLRLFVFAESAGRALPGPDWKRSPQEFAGEISRLGKEANGYSYDCEQLSHTAALKWLETRRAQARTAVKVNPKIYDAYVGQYQLRPERFFTVSEEGDRLFIDVPRYFKSELFPLSEVRFFLKTADLELTFIKDDKGQVTQLEIPDNAQKLVAKKIN